MNDVRIFEYEGTPITFNNGESVMVNATEMAKPFGKVAKDWLRTKASKEFLQVLSNRRICPFDDLVQVREGSAENGGGTWMHEDAALEFARWLSPEFGIWCNDRIKELMTYGITATPKTVDDMIADPDTTIRLLTALKHEREEKEKIEAVAKAKQQLLEEQAPKVEFANAVVGSKGSVLVGELSKMIQQSGVSTLEIDGEVRKIGPMNLFEWMRENHYLGSTGEYYNVPCQRYVDQGLFELKKNVFSVDGEMQSRNTTKVTCKGQAYFINLFKKGANAPSPSPSPNGGE